MIVGNVFSWLMIFASAALLAWLVRKIAEGDYAKLLPALCCLASIVLEVSWLLFPKTIVFRNIAWNVTDIGVKLSLFLAYMEARK